MAMPYPSPNWALGSYAAIRELVTGSERSSEGVLMPKETMDICRDLETIKMVRI